MESNFSIFDLERRKWELARERDGESAAGQRDLSGADVHASGQGAAAAEASSAGNGAMDLHEELVLALFGVQRALRTGAVPDPKPVLKALRKILDSGQLDRVYEYASLGGSESGLAEAWSFAALACMRIGLGLGFTPKKALYLGLAAALHDLGRIRLPERLHGAPEHLSPQDRAKLRTLPQVSAQIVAGLGAEFAWVAEVVSRLGQPLGASGPESDQGKQTAEFASIIGLVAHVMSRRNPGAGGNPFLQSEVIRDVVDTEKQLFARRVLKEFLDQISLFPVGTLVRLNNDSIGRVLATYKSQPMRPTLELLFDGLGKRKDRPKIIHLSSFPLLHIVAAVREADILREPRTAVPGETGGPQEES